MATENIMMDAVKNGGNRQELHEKIRTLSMEAGKNVKVEGKENNLLELIAADKEFNLTLEQKVVKPVLEANKAELGVKAEINV